MTDLIAPRKVRFLVPTIQRAIDYLTTPILRSVTGEDYKDNDIAINGLASNLVDTKVRRFVTAFDNLLVNPQFKTDSDYTKGTGWTIDPGKPGFAVFAAASSGGDLTQAAIVSASTDYVLVVKCSEYTSGTFTPKMGTASDGSITSVGITIHEITSNGTDFVLDGPAVGDAKFEYAYVLDRNDYRFDLVLNSRKIIDFAVVDGQNLLDVFPASLFASMKFYHNSINNFSTATEVTPVDRRTGLVGKSKPLLRFGGTDTGDKVEFADNSLLRIGNHDFTGEGFIKYSSLGTTITRFILSKGSAEAAHYDLRINANTSFLEFVANGDGGSDLITVTSNVAVPTDQRVHVAFRVLYDGGSADVFINGIPVGNQVISPTEEFDAAGVLRFGMPSYATTNNFLGDLEDWTFYNRGLSDAEILGRSNGDMIADEDKWALFDMVTDGAMSNWSDITHLVSWTEENVDASNTVNRSATFHSSPFSAALITIAMGIVSISQQIDVVAETSYSLTFWARGDGLNAGMYQIFDNSNSANIVAPVTTGVTAETYTEVTVPFTTPVGCISIQLRFLGSPAAATVRFDTVAVDGLVTDGNFDNWTTDTDLTNWTEENVDGSNTVDKSLTFQSANFAVALTTADAPLVAISQQIDVEAERDYELIFWAHGNNQVTGFYQIYDNSNGANIISPVSTGVIAATFTEVRDSFTTPVGCTSIQLRFLGSSEAGQARFDDAQITKIGASAAWGNQGISVEQVKLLDDSTNKINGDITGDIFVNAPDAENPGYYLMRFDEIKRDLYWYLSINEDNDLPLFLQKFGQLVFGKSYLFDITALEPFGGSIDYPGTDVFELDTGVFDVVKNYGNRDRLVIPIAGQNRSTFNEYQEMLIILGGMEMPFYMEVLPLDDEDESIFYRLRLARKGQPFKYQFQNVDEPWFAGLEVVVDL